MGSWSTDIMGGDTPYDYKGLFEDRFGAEDEMFNKFRADEGKPPLDYRAPTPEEAVAFIHEQIDGTDDDIIKQVTGFLVMERGGRMTDELRGLVLDGIDAETATGAPEWVNPQERLDKLGAFRKLVETYPAEGGKAELPHQSGLFETIANGLS